MIEGIVASLIVAAILGTLASLRRVQRRRRVFGKPIGIECEQMIRAPWGVALPGDLPDPSEFEAKRDLGERDAYDWLRGAGGINHGETKLRIVVIGRAPTPVLIQSIRAVVRHSDPYRRTLVECATAGALSSTMLLFDLDDPAPEAWETVQADFEEPKRVGGAPYFERGTIELGPGEHHDLFVVGQARRFRVEWWLEFDVLVCGKGTVIRLGDEGRPFVTNGLPRDRYENRLEWVW